LSKVLCPETVGFEFEALFGGSSSRQSFDADLEELLRLGTQVGWFSEDEEDWDGWFDRITGVRAAAMDELATVVNSSDKERRAALFRDLHGLVATATAMYDAADVDVTIDLRIPDIHQLVDDEYSFEQFQQFLRKTVTKQAMYRSETGHHSWYRTCIEDRDEKLKYRLFLQGTPRIVQQRSSRPRGSFAVRRRLISKSRSSPRLRVRFRNCESESLRELSQPPFLRCRSSTRRRSRTSKMWLGSLPR